MIYKILLTALILVQVFAFDLKKFSIPLKEEINFSPGLTASVDLDVLR
jgi:hypothetical protein